MILTDYQHFIHQSRYSRWQEETQRRETWHETVNRLISFYTKYIKDNYNVVISEDINKRLVNSIINMDVMPSMRALMTAGPALEKNHIAAYNCSYLPVDSPRSFDECLYILMHGTGVGFSVERQYINELPKVPEEFEDSETTIIVQDSKEGWHRGYKELINILYAGRVPKWDLSRLRPAGARLKTFGGRSSGPEPLDELFRFTVDTFKKSIGRKLNSLECHDLMCKIADVVVVGGVRRSALISLSNLSDDRMRHCKSGNWWDLEPQRALSNNSVCYTEHPDIGTFMREWTALYESKSGERGIFNRKAAQAQAAKYERRDPSIDYGTNPCCEIILRPKQFCNLSEVVVRATDTPETLQEKVEMATILGTIQSTFTNFKGIGRQWTRNTEEERLLGVSLTGILDNAMLSNTTRESLPALLSNLRLHAVEVNRHWADKLDIEASTAITVRADKKDPLTQFMVESGFPCEDSLDKPNSMAVFSFPMHSPKSAITRHTMTAIEHLELWKIYAEYWCEHKPSITVSVNEHEWLRVANFVYDNFDVMSGISFLPLTEMPKEINWENLADYERGDTTLGSQTLNCTGDICEVVDIIN